jgi:PPK2 family polyphosphate:nucleotide phosphotransferase
MNKSQSKQLVEDVIGDKQINELGDPLKMANHQLALGSTVHLSEMPTQGRLYHDDRVSAEAEFRKLREELIDWQRRLYAEDKNHILIVLQAMDAGGKDGTIRKVLRGVNPQGVQVNSFKVPSREELAHDYLWRIHKTVPKRGMIGVFNRSHYEDVLVVRVHKIVPETVWRPRYEQINNFEKLLAENGTSILKFYLHISKSEQRDRFQARIDDPSKNWKFSFDDLEKRKLWDEYMMAYEDVLDKTNTTWAPWHIIPADQKWYRNLAIVQIIVDNLRSLNPQYPKLENDFSDIVVR